MIPGSLGALEGGNVAVFAAFGSQAAVFALAMWALLESVGARMTPSTGPKYSVVKISCAGSVVG